MILKSMKGKWINSNLVFLFSTRSETIPPTAGAIPKPCPEKPDATIRPSQSLKWSITGRASGVRSINPPPKRI